MSDGNAIKWLGEIEDIPKKAQDPLAAEVMRRFNGAVMWQSSEQVNGASLRTVLERCWQQQNGVLSCDAQQRARELGVDISVNLTALKADIANAYLNDSLTSSGDSKLPWTIAPTPRPDISPVAKDEIMVELRQAIQAGNFDGDPQALIEMVRQRKHILREREMDKATKSADAMTLLLEDQCAEGGFNRALIDFLQYFPVYPFAVFSGPYITRAPRLTWGKHKPRIQTEVFPTFRAISPFDFAYSPDSPDTQRGTCVFTRTLWTRRELLDAARTPGYLHKNILEVLEQADSAGDDFNLDWLTRSPDGAQRELALWASNVSPIEVLTHYGVMSGRELAKYNFFGLDDNEYYNCQIAMVAGRVVQVKVFSDPRLQVRPIYTASFYRTGDRIAGDGIAQRLRDVERAYIASLMYLMRNAASASAPICEADYRRISQFMGEGDLGRIVPGSMYLVDSDLGNASTPAFRFTHIPSNLPAYVQLMEMFMQLADRITNIPASLHGEAVGSGAMRTFRGMSMLQGNATKALHSAVDNIAHSIFSPLGQLLYDNNMLFAHDAAVKGDSQIITKGADGLLRKEMERQSAMEVMQIIGGAAAALGQNVNLAPVLAWSLEKLLTSIGVPDSVTASLGLGGAGVFVGAAGPNPNPAPPSPTGDGVAADVAGGAI